MFLYPVYIVLVLEIMCKHVTDVVLDEFCAAAVKFSFTKTGASLDVAWPRRNPEPRSLKQVEAAFGGARTGLFFEEVMSPPPKEVVSLGLKISNRL